MHDQKPRKNELILTVLDENPGIQWAVENMHILNRLMECVRQGRTEEMKELIQQDTLRLDLKLADDEIRHIKDLVIILIQMLSVAAEEGSIPEMLALRLKEQSIRKLEQLNTVPAVYEFADTVKMDFCRYVHELHTPQIRDRRIRQAAAFIDRNLSEKITLASLARQAGTTKEHFTRIFKAETGMTAGTYIRRRRINAAKHMLLHTDKSILEISTYLAFSSQPYFQKVFKEETGVTPLAFRRQNQEIL